MEHVALTLLIALLYLAATVGFALEIARGKLGYVPPRWLILIPGILALLGHALVLYDQVVASHGMQLGFFQAGSAVGWLMAAIVLLAAYRLPVQNLAVVTLPIAALALLLARWLGTPETTAQERLVTEPGLQLHIISSVLAYSLLSIAALQSLVLAFQDYQLRNHHATGLVRLLPPLRAMDQMLFQILWLGFALLSVSLVSGVVFLDNLFEQHLVHKTTLSVTAWLVFATLLFGRWRHGWRGRIAIRWTLAGFVALMLAYFGTKLVLELILQR